jgi:hypothetical protein
MTEQLEQLVKQTIKHEDAKSVALGFLRYETIRTMNPRQFSELWSKNLKEGIPFDTLVDEEVLKIFS